MENKDSLRIGEWKINNFYPEVSPTKNSKLMNSPIYSKQLVNNIFTSPYNSKFQPPLNHLDWNATIKLNNESPKKINGFSPCRIDYSSITSNSTININEKKKNSPFFPKLIISPNNNIEDNNVYDYIIIFIYIIINNVCLFTT